MVNYREILRLNSLNYTQRQIAASVHSSRNTIREVLEVAAKAGGIVNISSVKTCKELSKSR
ncbi:hypothetical protein LNN31_09815 [Acetobacterium wieringae]|uniref:Helix-turn-helix domain-containing protein n=1 Tax=Acetobacterium wieringae TaxID=52694 RepID=A0ABY6H9D1_9FIRM|nr:hypothetical protein [Acetobacterium wieringae]UYO61083.1 hypothetical protein LNN31_09815 [Acetobacterium wieringae]